MYKQPTSTNPNLTLKTKAFLDALAKQKAKPLYELTYDQARSVLLQAQSQQKIPAQFDCDITDETFHMDKDLSVDVRLYRPKGNQNTLPLLVYYHGGGWVMGDKRTHQRLMQQLCTQVGCALLFVDYLNAPKGQYPFVLNQDYGALKHIVQNAAAYKIDPEKVIVAGDSVGGNMAIVMCLMAKNDPEKQVRILKQILLYPVTDSAMDSPSYQAFENGPWLTKKAMAYFWEAYAPNKTKRQEIFSSPLRASLDQLANLPPAFIITDENDVLRDEGEAFADRLSLAGNSVVAVRYKGTIHDFIMLDALSDTAPAKAAVRQIVEELKAGFAI